MKKHTASVLFLLLVSGFSVSATAGPIKSAKDNVKHNHPECNHASVVSNVDVARSPFKKASMNAKHDRPETPRG